MSLTSGEKNQDFCGGLMNTELQELGNRSAVDYATNVFGSQVKTQKASKRPYGVGLLVAGIDRDGPHLFESCPSGNYYEFNAYSIGARSQSARTYLE